MQYFPKNFHQWETDARQSPLKKGWEQFIQTRQFEEKKRFYFPGDLSFTHQTISYKPISVCWKRLIVIRPLFRLRRDYFREMYVFISSGCSKTSAFKPQICFVEFLEGVVLSRDMPVRILYYYRRLLDFISFSQSLLVVMHNFQLAIFLVFFAPLNSMFSYVIRSPSFLHHQVMVLRVGYLFRGDV